MNGFQKETHANTIAEGPWEILMEFLGADLQRSLAKWRQGAHTYRFSGLSVLAEDWVVETGEGDSAVEVKLKSS